MWSPLSRLKGVQPTLQFGEWTRDQAGIKIAGRNINNLKYADDTTLMAESEEELKSLLMKVKEESEKVGLKLNIPTRDGIQAPCTGSMESHPVAHQRSPWVLSLN